MELTSTSIPIPKLGNALLSATGIGANGLSANGIASPLVLSQVSAVLGTKPLVGNGFPGLALPLSPKGDTIFSRNGTSLSIFPALPNWTTGVFSEVFGNRKTEAISIHPLSRVTFESLHSVGTPEFSETISRMLQQRSLRSERQVFSTQAFPEQLLLPVDLISSQKVGLSKTTLFEDLGSQSLPSNQAGTNNAQIAIPAQTPDAYSLIHSAKTARSRAEVDVRLVPYDERPKSKKQKETTTRGKLRSNLQKLLRNSASALARLAQRMGADST